MQEKWTSTEWPWEQGYIVLVEQYKMEEHCRHFMQKEIAKLLQVYLKNIARTARIQLDRWHLLFEIIGRTKHHCLNLLNLPRNRQITMTT